MKFGAVPLEQALGGVLAHSIMFDNIRMRKGIRLEQADLDRLRAAGHREVTVALLDSDDIDENTAADRIATALKAPGHLVKSSYPSTGRVNLIAKAPGIARIDTGAINAVNSGDPMITCATVAPDTRMENGGLLATIKIISYAVPRQAVGMAEQAARLAKAAGAVGLVPVALKTATLIVTQTGAEPVMDKGVAATRARLVALGMSLDDVVVTPHDTAAIAAALRAIGSDLALILTASATSDPADTGPEAVRAAGGVVTRFGMPVDPGNLLFLGKVGARPVIGLPGCARSVALNGADWILERIACGLEVSDADIAAMGVGGLLKEIPQRPHPRRSRET